MRSALALGILLATLFLGGCGGDGVTEDMKNMTPEKARDQATALFESVTEAVGSDGWSREDRWVSCGQFDGENYIQWTSFAQRFEETELSPSEAVDQVAAGWRTLGLGPSAGPDPTASASAFSVSDPPLFEGVHGDGSITQFTLSGNAATFSASSMCFPGDILELQ